MKSRVSQELWQRCEHVYLYYWRNRRRNGNLLYRVLSRPVKWIAIKIRRYVPYDVEEKATTAREAYRFLGDRPKGLDGGLDDPNSRHCKSFGSVRLEFKIPRPLEEKVDGLLYTSQGRGWVNGKLYEKYSVDPRPYIADLIKPSQNIDCIPKGSILQLEHPYTYGDWFGEAMVTLARALPMIEPPLCMPRRLLERPYVLRDLRKLNIEVRAVEQSLLIQQAVVIHKIHPSLEVGVNEVNAYREALSIDPVYPKQGSILYLSRQGIKSESERLDRNNKSEIVAQILADLDATVVLTSKTSLDEYIALASQAETVIADHGGAMYNLSYWRTKNLIELYSNNWWHKCFLSFGKSLGIENYSLVCVDNLDRSGLRDRLIAEIRRLNALKSVVL